MALTIGNMPALEDPEIPDGPNTQLVLEIPSLQCMCTFVGAFNNGKANGPGVVTITPIDGGEENVYEGNFVNGKAHGAGAFLFHFQQQFVFQYEGEYDSGRLINGSFKYLCFTLEGQGKIQDGQIVKYGTIDFAETKSPGNYEGAWDANMCPHGQGKLKFEDGRSFEGEFVNGACAALGLIVYPNGNVFEGDVVDNKSGKRGRLVAWDRSCYEGEFLDGVPNGKGEYFGDNDGVRYVGDFEKGVMKGHGELYLPDGKKYKGQMDKNAGNGQGIMEVPVETKDGEKTVSFEGVFENGQLIGKGKVIAIGFSYEGDIVNFQMQGNGFAKWFDEKGNFTRTFEGQFNQGNCVKGHFKFYESGDEYKGEVNDEILHGTGVYTTKAYKYFGKFEDGFKHGNGRVVFSDGSSWTGTFEKGEPKDLGTFLSQGKESRILFPKEKLGL
jgi:hypothetical protein